MPQPINKLHKIYVVDRFVDLDTFMYLKWQVVLKLGKYHFENHTDIFTKTPILRYSISDKPMKTSLSVLSRTARKSLLVHLEPTAPKGMADKLMMQSFHKTGRLHHKKRAYINDDDDDNNDIYSWSTRQAVLLSRPGLQ